MKRLHALFLAGSIGMLWVLAAGAQAPVEEIQVDSGQGVPMVQEPETSTIPATEQAVPSAHQAPADQVPTEATQTMSSQGVPYLSGGIGKDEREQLEATASDYNLKLVFAESSGAFVADVSVTIKNADGSTVLDGNSTGPLFFTKLPAGEYSVQATYRGATDTRNVTVAETGQKDLDFRW